MTERRRLPNRRGPKRSNSSATVPASHITVGYFANNHVGEVFMNADRVNSSLDALISDSAIIVSLCLQWGASLQEIAHALKRDSQGRAASPIGAALDRIAGPYGAA